MASKPIILTVDDEPQVLNAVERDLRRHYRDEYRIVKVGLRRGGARRGARVQAAAATPIALFLVDQRMPAMTGTEFLAEARKLYPEAAQGAAHRLRRHRGRDRTASTRSAWTTTC